MQSLMQVDFYLLIIFQRLIADAQETEEEIGLLHVKLMFLVEYAGAYNYDGQ